ncbi:MAG: hypothetical protein KGL35_11910 [Bradyrhizobium sp.]|nr:hypothetical protein [Bradyrhizobium sp.]
MIPQIVAFGRLPHDPAAFLKTRPVPYRMMMPQMGAVKRPDWQPCLGHNDVWGTCSTTGLANAARMVEMATGGDLDLSDDLIAEAFAAWTGTAYNDAAMRASAGAVLLDILNQQAAGGFNAGTPTPLVGLVGRIGTSRMLLARAIQTFHHAYIGVDLRQRDMEQVAVWDIAAGRDDGPVAGGHCVALYDFAGLGDADTVRIATWGTLMPATWSWVEARIMEAYALAWRQLEMPNVDFDALEEALVA